LAGVICALKIEEIEAERAKERMAAGGGDKKSGTQKIGEPIGDTGKARDKAARGQPGKTGRASRTGYPKNWGT
jgi:hypothetical protein